MIHLDVGVLLPRRFAEEAARLLGAVLERDGAPRLGPTFKRLEVLRREAKRRQAVELGRDGRVADELDEVELVQVSVVDLRRDHGVPRLAQDLADAALRSFDLLQVH